MTVRKLPKSIRKFIRREKARIRRQVLDLKKQEELINELYQRLLKTELPQEAKVKKRIESSSPTNENKRNLQSSHK